jgi:hypothetical protein
MSSKRIMRIGVLAEKIVPPHESEQAGALLLTMVGYVKVLG